MMASEFSVKFRGPSGELAVPEDAARRARADTSQPSLARRLPRPTGSILSQPYAPEPSAPGGGTVAAWTARRTRLIIAGAAGAVLLVVVLGLALRGGGDDDQPGRDRVGTSAGDGTGSDVVGAGSDAVSASPDAVSASLGVGSAEVAVDDGQGAGSDADVIDMGSSAPPNTNAGSDARPPRVNPADLFKAGMQAYVKGDARTAIGQFRKAVQASPGYAAAWRALGLAHEKLGEWGQAKTALQRYLQLAPTAPDAKQIRDRIGNL